MRIISFIKQLLQIRHCLVLFLIIGNIACSDNVRIDKTLDTLPTIFPDYTNVTIPYNIAPLSFKLIDSSAYTKIRAIFEHDMQQMNIKAKNRQFTIPPPSWKKFMKDAAGSTVSVTIQAKSNDKWISYPAFQIFVAPEPVDPYIVYRLIEPGYDIWNEMGIYQRHIEDFHESTIINNKRTGYGCMNCHSFNMQNPDQMLFHMRASNPGTIMINGDQIEKLNTNTDQTLSALVYPSWHPSGDFVAFSVNDTKQIFHTTDPNRIEVFDFASDVVVYDVNRHEIITSALLNSTGTFETFPTFSPDGKTMFFCSADTVSMPDEYNNLRYSLCSISFDPANRTFGTEVDTLYNAGLVDDGKSVSFPRVSPDGKYLMFTLAGYGNFSIWHKDADLYMIDLQNNTTVPLSALNSDDVDSYHSWSSNSRWVVFSSRRIDGLYTRPYIAYINDAGEPAKPFLLPQKDVEFYHSFMKSYNIPEFITSKVEQNGFKLSEIAINDNGIDVTFGGTR